MKDKKYVKIENRGKVEEELLFKTEDFLKFLLYDFQKGDFNILNPKMFYVFNEEELKKDDDFGFEFTLFSDIFKGRVEIRKKKDNSFSILFNKRYPAKGKFIYKPYIEKKNIALEDLFKQFDFVIKGENRQIKTGKVYLLKNGMVGIVRKYYSNSKIGIVYDEYASEVEEFVKIEDIEEEIR